MMKRDSQLLTENLFCKQEDSTYRLVGCKGIYQIGQLGKWTYLIYPGALAYKL